MKENKDIKAKWHQLLNHFQVAPNMQENLWEEIEKHYNSKNRHYHNLTHLSNMIEEFEKYEAKIEHKELLLFSIFYHDIIYNPIRKDNELKSAEKMKFRLKQINISEEIIDSCFRQILQTQSHQISGSNSTDDKYLLDFDLEILGKDWETYKEYTQQIRKEYWMYPMPVYKKGRKAAMTQFLEREFIYCTEVYREQKEYQARMNIMREIEEVLI
ncbi:MAG: hypothetical protein MI974_08430 [Chitinophagales bacterium]|nr:hypothetical protein [Chitinophagales bacterium]